MKNVRTVSYVTLSSFLLNGILPFPFTLKSIIYYVLIILLIWQVARFKIRGHFIVWLYILWMLFEFVRGYFISEDYWDHKTLYRNVIVYSSILFVFIGQSFIHVKDILSFWFSKMVPILPFFLLFFPARTNFIPLLFIIPLFLYTFTRKGLLMVLLLLLNFLSAFEERGSIIKLFAILLITLYGLVCVRLLKNSKFFLRITRLVHLVLLLLPLWLLWLGVSGKFNIFKIQDYFVYETSSDGEDLLADTRSLLYFEVFQSACENKNIVLGNSPSKGYNSDSFGYADVRIMKGTRTGCEVGFLDVFAYFGLIGVVLYYLIFVYASAMAIYKSKNVAVKLWGIWLSFLWMWSFVWEKPTFDPFYLFDMLLIGMCLSSQLRSMSDDDMKRFASSVIK